ncbi:MAG: GGDEF domain-containing protein [Clostridia bacterium]|nr:GGDEF domain-containing protein [Clostridia bacterium]
MKTTKNGERGKGISVHALVLPLVIVLAVLHVAIIGLFFSISSESNRLSSIMRNAGTYTQDASSLIGGSSLLSETASNFVLMPLAETGEVNVGPLMAYAQELAVDRRGDQIMARFQEYSVSEEAKALLAQAADSAISMMKTQLHAIALVNAVYPIPHIAPLTNIPLPELTAEEAAMADVKKLSTARGLVLGTEYGLSKQNVSQMSGACVGMIQQQAAQESARTAQHVGVLRAMMWVATMSVVVILICAFITLYLQVTRPLGRFEKLIPQDEPLDEKRGFREVRLVARAYNGVLKRRNDLDQILRSAAETDALTNLPNRYRFEQCVVESQDSGCSMAVVLFDVNYLKRTNDTEGHLAGDELLRHAADCIAACFGENCFRYGGDEFAAIVTDCTRNDIDEMIRKFEKKEEQENVSISVGCAYTDDIGKTTVQNLLEEADRNMYAQKKIIHEQG